MEIFSPMPSADGIQSDGLLTCVFTEAYAILKSKATIERESGFMATNYASIATGVKQPVRANHRQD